MSRVTSEEAEDLLKEFIDIRVKYKSNSKKYEKKYNQCKLLCIEKFDYIAQNKVRKYKAFSNYDDLLQEGRIALMLALNSYETGRGCWFWWANQYVKTKISREANKHSTVKIPIKQTKNMLPYKVAQMPVMTDDTDSAIDSMETSERTLQVHSAISKLPSLQRKVVEMYFEVGAARKESNSIASICNELDLTRKDCVKILTQAKRDLKKHLESSV